VKSQVILTEAVVWFSSVFPAKIQASTSLTPQPPVCPALLNISSERSCHFRVSRYSEQCQWRSTFLGCDDVSVGDNLPGLHDPEDEAAVIFW